MTENSIHKFREGIYDYLYLCEFNNEKYNNHTFLLYSGEKVLCFHGPLIYEAKCLEVNVTKEKQVRYFIHYTGWNKRYI